ncbi:MAG: hypothetical protein EBY29_14270 [Planctomycetes bacterium]|nr:hypothetical protein [Planctomycetota bacterium]
MKFPHKNICSFVREAAMRIALSFLTISLVVGATLSWSAPSAMGIPPTRSVLPHAFPPAFVAMMEIQFGHAWMHTVQERVILRMYATWLEKEASAKKKKKG